MVSLHIGHIFMGAQYVLVQKDYGWYPEGARVVVNEETKNEGELVRWIHVEEAGDVLAWIKVRNNCCIGEEGLCGCICSSNERGKSVWSAFRGLSIILTRKVGCGVGWRC